MSSDFFMQWIAPGSLGGVTLGLWLKLLSQNHWSVAPRYLGRVAMITFLAAFNSLAYRVEQIRFGRSIDQAVIHPPLFVLGYARSGTTHLLNLLCQDDRFAFPNTFQVMNPQFFLTTERWLAPIQQPFYLQTRPFDNLKTTVREPNEDEFAVAAMTGLSPLSGWVFPRSHRKYETYIDFFDASKDEVNRWSRALLHFVKKLSLKYGKPVVLKSPFHTARVRLLLDLFPQAKFVYIHRHPHDVYASNMNLVRRAVPIVSVQRFDVDELSDRLIPNYKHVTKNYLDQRSMIPDGHLVEIGFRELDQSPISSLRHVYEQLSLPAFEVAEPAIRNYLASLRGYRKNVYTELDPQVKSLLAREWRRSFEEWGYEA